MKILEHEPIEIGTMEERTPAFQKLTIEQQNARRNLLSQILKQLREPSTLGLTEEQTILFMSDLLEFHLTGRIDRYTTPLIQKRKK